MTAPTASQRTSAPGEPRVVDIRVRIKGDPPAWAELNDVLCELRALVEKKYPSIELMYSHPRGGRRPRRRGAPRVDVVSGFIGGGSP
jgi:hypothetical protein